MRKSTEARIHHRQTKREMIRCAVAGALTGIALTVGIATATLTLTPKPPTPVVEVESEYYFDYEVFSYCYDEDCPSPSEDECTYHCFEDGCVSPKTGFFYCTFHRVLDRIDRVVADSAYDR